MDQRVALEGQMGAAVWGGRLVVLPQAEVLNQIQKALHPLLLEILLLRLNLVHEPEAGPLCGTAEKVVLL